MKVAMTVRDNYITPAFDVSRDFLALGFSSGRVVDQYLAIFTSTSPLQKTSQLKRLGVKRLICGAISNMLVRQIATYGIETIPCVAGQVDDVIAAYLAGTLPDPTLMVPGCLGSHSKTKSRQKPIHINF